MKCVNDHVFSMVAMFYGVDEIGQHYKLCEDWVTQSVDEDSTLYLDDGLFGVESMGCLL